MTWSIVKQEEINPDFKMVEEILDKLNRIFDAYEVFHHSASGEMFEFTYQKDSSRREAWQITFMGKSVVSGGMFGLDYEDFHEEDYLHLIDENAEKIYSEAYNGAIAVVSNLLRYVSFSDIPKEAKQNWIDIINNGITRVEEDKNKDNHCNI